MNYFHLIDDREKAIEYWAENQFNLCDIVLSLTDNLIPFGVKIYDIFSRDEVLNLMEFFSCDFAKMKQDLGIVGNYVERKGDIYSQNFNPKRERKALTLSSNEMKRIAKIIYDNLMNDLEKIAKVIAKSLK